MIKLFDVGRRILVGRAEACVLIQENNYTGILRNVELTKVLKELYRIELNGYKVEGLFSAEDTYLKVRLEDGIMESELLPEVKFSLVNKRD